MEIFIISVDTLFFIKYKKYNKFVCNCNLILIKTYNKSVNVLFSEESMFYRNEANKEIANQDAVEAVEPTENQAYSCPLCNQNSYRDPRDYQQGNWYGPMMYGPMMYEPYHYYHYHYHHPYVIHHYHHHYYHNRPYRSDNDDY
ncbi:hypothetical protein NL50_12185 [Clostridium acetobutylicum]|nr:hypothetical protein NL50_12185 [Clostridium acetobutylicum]